jgi:hypothetical protein
MSTTSPKPETLSTPTTTAGHCGSSQVTRRVIHRCTELEQQAAAQVAKHLLALSEKTGFVFSQHVSQSITTEYPMVITVNNYTLQTWFLSYSIVERLPEKKRW